MNIIALHHHKFTGTLLVIYFLFFLRISAQTAHTELVYSESNIHLLNSVNTDSDNSVKKRFNSRDTDLFDRKNSVEGSILLPIAPGNETSFKYTRRIWKKERTSGEFVTGIHFHINSERDGGTYDDYQIILGYRHFFWKGLNFEAGIQPKLYYRLKNATFSDRTHDGYGLFVYSMAGYQFEAIKKQNYSFIVNVQPVGLAYSAYHSDNWAKDAEGSETDDLLYFGNISIGIRF
ncbi:hypothetical protein J8281_16255 [Aquimarina sp. U1-2]|uniref:hypothetical protein n=1 Tax=Aquimarina sp. U1-2 TaxID=2823141 RepID=UPI001AECF903|nr:hypothetical protein [Aquimarina sp. U1-2]MBP2833749.1 hypothetical protein [Aquimarina sp. U1-2]